MEAGFLAPKRNSPGTLIKNQAEDFQACSSNNYQLPPTQWWLRRKWCRSDDFPATNSKPPSSIQEDKPKGGVGASQLDSGQETPA